MARVELAPEVADDFDRILEHLAQYRVEDASSRVHDIIAAISVLERNPFIGRPVEAEKRELVRARGYLALCRYVTEVDTVFVHALRSQREAARSDSSPISSRLATGLGA